MKNKLGLKGKFRIENITTGQIVNQTNSIHNVGFSSTTAFLGSGIPNPNSFSYISLGVGSSAINTADTTLGSEYLKQSADSIAQTTTTVSNDTLTFEGNFIADAAKTINEAGIFNASGTNTGSMLARTGFADIVAASGDKINVTYSIQVS